MAFSEVREYQYGDDPRSMDWNVTARLRSPYVKVYEEEREMTVVLLIDISRSGLFGTAEMTKKDLIAAKERPKPSAAHNQGNNRAEARVERHRHKRGSAVPDQWNQEKMHGFRAF